VPAGKRLEKRVNLTGLLSGVGIAGMEGEGKAYTPSLDWLASLPELTEGISLSMTVSPNGQIRL
jgi:hypothetical protein